MGDPGPNSVVITPVGGLISAETFLWIRTLEKFEWLYSMDMAARFKKENCKYVSVSLEGLAS